MLCDDASYAAITAAETQQAQLRFWFLHLQGSFQMIWRKQFIFNQNLAPAEFSRKPLATIPPTYEITTMAVIPFFNIFSLHPN